MQNGECRMKVSDVEADFSHFRRKYHNFAFIILRFAFSYITKNEGRYI